MKRLYQQAYHHVRLISRLSRLSQPVKLRAAEFALNKWCDERGACGQDRRYAALEAATTSHIAREFEVC